MLTIYRWPEFQTLHVKSIWWEVIGSIYFFLNIFLLYRKNAKFSFCIDVNLRVLPA